MSDFIEDNWILISDSAIFLATAIQIGIIKQEYFNNYGYSSVILKCCNAMNFCALIQLNPLVYATLSTDLLPSKNFVTSFSHLQNTGSMSYAADFPNVIHFITQYFVKLYLLILPPISSEKP